MTGRARGATEHRDLTRRRFLALTGALGGAAALTACGASIDAGGVRPQAMASAQPYDGPPQELDFWTPFTGGDGPAMQRLVEAFQAEHPAIRVRTTPLAANDMYAKVLPAVGAQQGPHVVAMHLDQLPTYALRGTILPIDDAVEAAGLVSADYVPGAWEQGVYRGRRWGLPLDVFALGQFWSAEAFAAAGVTGPLTGEGFDAAVAALQASGVAHPFSVAPGNWQLWLTLLAQNGGALFDESGRRATFASEAGVEALAWMRGLVDSGASAAGVPDAWALFKAGASVVTSNTPAGVADLQATAPDLQWGVAPFPTIGERPALFANSHHLVLSEQSQADEDVAHASSTFVTWLSRNSAAWAQSGNVPAFAAERADPELVDAPQAVLATDEVLATYAFLPLVPSSRDIAANSYQRAVSQAVLGQAGPADALTFAQRTAQDQLDQLNALYGI